MNTTAQQTTADQTIHFCEDCNSMLYSFCLVAHTHGPADKRSLEIVSEYHAAGCAWVARAQAKLDEQAARLAQGYNFIETVQLAGGNTATIEFKFGGRGIGFLATVKRSGGEVVDSALFSAEHYARDWAQGFNAHHE